MEPDKVAADEARRIAQHERIKGKLENDVQAEITERAAVTYPADGAQIASMAAGLRRKATGEVLETENEIERTRSLARFSQVVDYLFFLIYSVIGLEIALELFGARQSSSFKRFLDTVSAPLLGPFRGLMPDPAVGSLQLMLSYIVALVVYCLLHAALNRLLRLFVVRKTTV